MNSMGIKEVIVYSTRGELLINMYRITTVVTLELLWENWRSRLDFSEPLIQFPTNYIYGQTVNDSCKIPTSEISRTYRLLVKIVFE